VNLSVSMKVNASEGDTFSVSEGVSVSVSVIVTMCIYLFAILFVIFGPFPGIISKSMPIAGSGVRMSVVCVC
jgi:hypothetical protein